MDQLRIRSDWAELCKRLWTVLDVDGELLIVPGVLYVNRMGYLMSNEPYPEEESINLCFSYARSC